MSNVVSRWPFILLICSLCSTVQYSTVQACVRVCVCVLPLVLAITYSGLGTNQVRLLILLGVS